MPGSIVLNGPRKQHQQCPYSLSVRSLRPPSWKKEESVDQLFQESSCDSFTWATSVCTKWLQSSFGKNWESNPEAKEFTLDIIRDMKRRVKSGLTNMSYHFSIYSTPSESLTDRFCRLDTEKFGSIPDITDKEYYTNSFHYDVRKIQHRLKNWTLRKFTQKQVHLVASSIIVSIQFFNKIQSLGSCLGLCL